MVEVNTTRHPANFKDLTGLTFGRWLVLLFSGLRATGAYWLCRCECGTERMVRGSSLRSGGSTSCGCLSREILAARNTTHGLYYAPEHNTWAGMIQRCTNRNDAGWDKYGGRGITVCQRWRESFAAFLADMGPRPSAKHSLDRFPNNDGNYEPGNCRWATMKEQSRNTRWNRLIVHDGRTQCLEEWAEETGLAAGVISDRLRSGWSVAKALFTPMRSARH